LLCNERISLFINFGTKEWCLIIDALVTRNDVIVYDGHACIIDGVRLHSGKRFTYKHNDIMEKNPAAKATKIAEATGGGTFYY
jgi:glycine C-acetyltransferase